MGILGYFARYVALPSIFPAVILFSASAMAGSPKLIEASRAQEIVSLRRHDDDIKREDMLVTDNCALGYGPLEPKHPVTFLVYMLGIVWTIVGMRVVSERYFARAMELHKSLSRYNASFAF